MKLNTMNAAILTIGQEILIGQIIDTNSAWIAQKLNEAGVNVQLITSIPDENSTIISVVNELLNKFNLVLVTGGLGPTSDDVTKHALCELFDCKLTTHQPTLERIKNLFSSRGLPVTRLNEMQADVPDRCEVLDNPLGTAPGMWFKHGDSVLVSMPGVPFEMKSIMENHVIPRLLSQSTEIVIVHKTVHTFGLPESFLADKISEWESNLPKSISLAYLPSPNSIRLRLSSTGNNKELIHKVIYEQIEKLKAIIPDNIFGYDNDTMALVVANLLKNSNSTLALAESCTGGNISHLITSIPGSSAFFNGSVVAYSNKVKEEVLGVNAKLIEEHGAVSKQVVESMAVGVRKLMNSDYSIATSGIAGPTGGTQAKPVGTIWVAISSRNFTESKLFKFGNDRERNIIRSSISALNMLRLHLLSR